MKKEEPEKMYEEKKIFTESLGAIYIHSDTDHYFFVLPDFSFEIAYPGDEYVIASNNLIRVNGNSHFAIQEEIEKGTAATGYVGKTTSFYSGKMTRTSLINGCR